MPEKPDECDCCGYGTEKLISCGPGRKDIPQEELPWTQADHWLCRLCATGLGFEVHQGRVNHGIVQALNVILEELEPKG